MRESDSGSGCVCCSGGMGGYAKKEPSYREIRESAGECGRLHRELRDRYGEDVVEIIQIEPKDYVYVIPRVFKDVIKRRDSLISSIRTLMLWHPVPVVIVNGRVMGNGNFPEAREIYNELDKSPARS